MSRIHEALRRAGEDRRVNAPAPPGAGAHRPEDAAGAATPQKPEESVVAADLESEPVPRPAGLLRALVEHCPAGEWAPDANTILFYGEEFRTPGSEEFRTLRSRLELVRDRQPLTTLLITSPLPGEGKTFLAANLAQVITWQRERHVLLIDADLRSCRLHKALGVAGTPGLSDYLSGAVDEFAVVKRSPLDNFFFIPGGTPAANASELIANGRLRTLLRRLTSAFDWILIDSPPVIPVTDARLIAELADGVLLVIQTGTTPGDLAQAAFREFRGKPFVGVVMNRMSPQRGYGYAYGYGSREDQQKPTGLSRIFHRA